MCQTWLAEFTKSEPQVYGSVGRAFLTKPSGWAPLHNQAVPGIAMCAFDVDTGSTASSAWVACTRGSTRHTSLGLQTKRTDGMPTFLRTETLKETRRSLRRRCSEPARFAPKAKKTGVYILYTTHVGLGPADGILTKSGDAGIWRASMMKHRAHSVPSRRIATCKM